MVQSSLTDQTVVVGMSGGVDSSVAALILKNQGYSVLGLFMKNWDEQDPNGVCQAAKDYEDVQRVCERLDIPCHSVEFVGEYWDRVFKRFLADYEAGLTPNPDVLCNREIKFDAFYEKARALGGDLLATGHYCRTQLQEGVGTLLKGVDAGKDQSYFLHQVDGARLANVLFPIGGLPKSEVRRMALEAGLPTHSKKDSTGICFIGERDFPEFLGRYLKGEPGEFRDVDTGAVVGRHRGYQFYTLGQRKGLGLGGAGDRWFVAGKEPRSNVVYVTRGGEHPALYSDELWADELSWVAGRPPEGIATESGEGLRCKAKVRYRQADQDCVATLDPASGKLRVRFDLPQRAVTPGQSVVLYQGELCLGGGVIRGTTC